MAILGSGNVTYEVSGEEWGQLPKGWVYGDATSVAVDSHDNPWILHGDSDRVREFLEQEGKDLAPPVVQFDPEGNVLQAWGGPGEGYDWMQRTFGSEHGMFIDHEDNVWVIGGGTSGFDGGVVLLQQYAAVRPFSLGLRFVVLFLGGL